MSEHTYKLIELVGSSKVSSDDAVKNAITKAGDSITNIRWFQIVETRGQVENGQIAYWQVTLKVGFTVAE